MVVKQNGQQIYCVSYVLILNAQQGDIICSEIHHNMAALTIKFKPYRSFIPGPSKG